MTIVVLALLFAPACETHAATPRPLRVAFLFTSGTMASMWMAKETGGFAKEGLEVEMISMSSALALPAAILGGVVYPIRRYALGFSDEPIFFGAVVGIVGLFCTSAFLALPTTKDRLVWNKDSIGYFIAGGAFEYLGLLLVLYALTFGPVVMVTPRTATLPLWVVILSKLFLHDMEKITVRIVIGALLVVAGEHRHHGGETVSSHGCHRTRTEMRPFIDDLRWPRAIDNARD